MELDTQFLNNVAVDHRLVGLEVLLSPFAAHTYSQRLAMLASQLPQAMVLTGGEYPRISTGYENQVGTYEYNSAKLDNDSTILAVIPKYITGHGVSPIMENPLTTIIYRNNDTGECSYINVDTHTKCMDGHGYRNKIMNTHYLIEDNYIPGGTQFTSSPIHTDRGYGLGLNVNAAYLAVDGVTKDAFIISEDLADRMTSTAIRTLEIRLSPNQIPLNIYGDEFEHKFMPDIGEMVGADSLIMCLRTVTAQSYLLDIASESINRPQYLTDRCYTVPHNNASVIDIDVLVNYRACRNLSPIYDQINKYRDGINRYFTRIIETYNEIRRKNYPCSPILQNLITTAYARLLADNAKVPEYNKKAAVKLVRKKEQVEFITITITYKYDNVVSLGYKMTDRQGGKGVISAIWPVEWMPVDEYGIKSDIIITPEAIPNRMIPSALYEVHITRADEFVRRRMYDLYHGGFPMGLEAEKFDLPISTDWEGAWNYFYEYITTVNTNMGMILDQVCFNDELKKEQVEAVINEGVYHVIPPYLDNLSDQFILDLEDKFPTPEGTVQFTLLDAFGQPKVHTKEGMAIGSKYMYLLCKIPNLKSSGVAYTNQYKTPIQTNKEQKSRYPISQTPLRMGEDEVRNLIMAIGAGPVLRLMGLYANSTDGVQTLCRALLNANLPSALKRINLSTDYIVNTNNIIAMVQHLLATIGLSTNDPVTDGEELIHELSI